MKKALSLLFIAGTMSLVACGPSAEEKAKMDEEDAMKRDSMMKAAGDSMLETVVEEEAATADTIAADTAAPVEVAPAEETQH